MAAELEALRARALPLLAQAPALSRAAIDQALHGASHAQYDRERDVWRASRGASAFEHEDIEVSDVSESPPLGMLGHVTSPSSDVAPPLGHVADSSDGVDDPGSLGMLGHVTRPSSAVDASPIEIARSGFEGDGEPLPFASTVQTAFGRHDVSRSGLIRADAPSMRPAVSARARMRSAIGSRSRRRPISTRSRTRQRTRSSSAQGSR